MFSWLTEFDSHAQWLIDEIDKVESLEMFLNRLAFCDSEDACVNPTLWRSLGSADEVTENMDHFDKRGKLTTSMIPKIIKLG